MKVSEIAAIFARMPQDAEVMRRGALGVFEPLEVEGLCEVELTRYADPGMKRGDSTRAWFEAGTLTDRIRKIESTEVREAVVLKRAEPEEEA